MMLKTIFVVAAIAVCLLNVAEARRTRESAFLEVGAQASVCQIKDNSGQIQQWNCPFDNPVCCSFSARACCPQGYVCDESAQPVKCRKSTPSASAASTGSGTQTITVFPKITINPPSTPSSASESSMGPAPSSEVSRPPAGMESSSVAPPTSPMGNSEASSSVGVRVPPFRQNIIIVKNINVLTKAQQPAPPPPRESEESSERSERSERSEASESSRSRAESSESSRESSERSERSEVSSRS